MKLFVARQFTLSERSPAPRCKSCAAPRRWKPMCTSSSCNKFLRTSAVKRDLGRSSSSWRELLDWRSSMKLRRFRLSPVQCCELCNRSQLCNVRQLPTREHSLASSHSSALTVQRSTGNTSESDKNGRTRTAAINPKQHTDALRMSSGQRNEIPRM